VNKAPQVFEQNTQGTLLLSAAILASGFGGDKRAADGQRRCTTSVTTIGFDRIANLSVR